MSKIPTHPQSGTDSHDSRYRVIRRLGRGGMGDVLLVYDEVRGEEVALKRILEHSAETLIRFKREFREIADLFHPNLVRLHDLGEGEAGPFFTMEAIDGHDLRTWCQMADRTTAAAPGNAPTRPGRDATVAQTCPTLAADVSALARADAESATAPTVAADTARQELGPSSGELPTLDSISDVSELAPASHEHVSADGPTVDASTTATRSTSTASRAPRGRAAVDAVLHAAPQLVEALAFLHDNGIVHRDLKPANVMVRSDGVVKLLDFGILATPAEQASESGQVMGTIGFMAPEQFRDAPPSPETDLYSLGATLFVLLAGRPLFEATSPVKHIIRQQNEDVPRLGTLVDGVPGPLADCVAGLLSRDPSARPDLAQVAGALEAAGGRRAEIRRSSPDDRRLLGRDALLEYTVNACRTGISETASPVVLAGESGTGKTALSESVHAVLERDGVLVLRGRGRQNERLAFNALDAIVDEVAVRLDHLDRTDERSALAAAASATFPVLEPHGTGDATPNQHLAIQALGRLISACAPNGRALLVIDDLQWADDDSLLALHKLCARGRGILATLRSDLATNRVQSWLDAMAAETIAVGDLPDTALAAIVRREAARAGHPTPAPSAVDDAVRLSQGKPFLAEVAGRALARGTGGDPLEALVTEAVEEDEDLLAALVAAAEWTDIATLAAHTCRVPGDVDDAVRSLARAGVVRRAGDSGPAGLVDIYHDAIRSGLDALLRQSLPDAHSRFADLALAGRFDGMPPARLVRHLVSASRFEEAVERAVVAADAAAEQLAYGLEADMLAVALEHGTWRGERRTVLLERRAEALEKTARYQEAASCWDAIEAMSEGPVARAASIRAANDLLGANMVEEGAQRLDAALQSGGDRNLTKRGLGDWGGALRFLWGPRRNYRLTPNEDPALRRAAEADVRLGLMLGFFMPLKGLRVLLRAFDAFKKLGDADRVAWCLLLFACFADFAKLGPKASRLARRFEKAGARVCERYDVDSAEHDAIRQYLRSTDAMRKGRWDDGIDAAREAMRLMDAVGKRGVFEYTYAVTMVGTIAYLSQDLGALESTLSQFRSIQQSGGDLTLATHEGVISVAVACLEGRFDDARTDVRRSVAALPSNHVTIQRAVVGFVGCLPEIYAGDPSDALTRVIETEPYSKHFRLMQSHIAPIHAAFAALSEVLALKAGDERASRRRLRGHLKVVDAGGPMAAGVGDRVRAYLAEAGGRPQEALRHFESARIAAREAERPVDAAIATFQLGIRSDGEAGAELRRRAREAVLTAGASPSILHEDPQHRDAQS